MKYMILLDKLKLTEQEEAGKEKKSPNQYHKLKLTEQEEAGKEKKSPNQYLKSAKLIYISLSSFKFS